MALNTDPIIVKLIRSPLLSVAFNINPHANHAAYNIPTIYFLAPINIARLYPKDTRHDSGATLSCHGKLSDGWFKMRKESLIQGC